ncbi:MurR/RpiR family transcriptional regulator [Enterococcus hulanensis]|uniref:MurR/RpiR family transcriptional regulator n=1 Tax=Enterococcus TaxID=1350 RepID=UPI000B5A537E|nr:MULTISPECIES: MurR/RpiR family transcriptional regulator [Enterococcus]MBO0413144.1 MurR/RpiR family transcriptional regulator [Enterococcus hulanensis]OTO15232.1 hypothetical protein A5875_004390 [Enterococcus sp. 3H8_DIV0648]
MEKRTLDLIQKKIDSLEPSFTNSDKKIAQQVLKNPEEFVKQRTTEISEVAGTSVAGITRFVKKMGYDKLTDFKLAITRDLEVDHSIPYEDITANDSALTLSRKVITHNAQGLMDIEDNLKEEELKECIRLITNATKISFVGLGGSISVAQDAYLKFMRMGKNVELLTDVHLLTISASVSQPDQVILVVSHEGANTELNAALKIASENGVKILAITQFSMSPLAKIADICLYTFSKGFSYKPEPLISRVSEYTLVDILYVAFCMYSGKNIKNQLKVISENLKQFKNYEA